MEQDPEDKARTGEKVEDYRFTQRVNSREYHVNQHIQEDIESLYALWFKYDCVDDGRQQDGFTYSVDHSPETRWENFMKGLDGCIEDWKKYKKEITYQVLIMVDFHMQG